MGRPLQTSAHESRPTRQQNRRLGFGLGVGNWAKTWLDWAGAEEIELVSRALSASLTCRKNFLEIARMDESGMGMIG